MLSAARGLRPARRITGLTRIRSLRRQSGRTQRSSLARQTQCCHRLRLPLPQRPQRQEHQEHREHQQHRAHQRHQQLDLPCLQPRPLRRPLLQPRTRELPGSPECVDPQAAAGRRLCDSSTHSSLGSPVCSVPASARPSRRRGTVAPTPARPTCRLPSPPQCRGPCPDRSTRAAPDAASSPAPAPSCYRLRCRRNT